MDISSALTFLRNAPTEALQIHKSEAVSAFREIEERLGGLGSPQNGAVCETIPISRSFLSEKHLSEAQSVKIQVTKLLNALAKDFSWVWDSIKLEPKQFLAMKRKRTCDRRLRDIRRIDGNLKPENRDKLLRGLAQRSLALEGVKCGYLDVDEMCEKMNNGNLKGGRNGKTVQFVTNELGIESDDQDFAVRATREGMKQLVMERVLTEKLKETLLQTLQETQDETLKQTLGEMIKGFKSASGISVFTALALRPFRYLKYGEIPEFANCLLEPGAMPSLILMEAESDSIDPIVFITNIMRKTSDWLEELQLCYDACITCDDQEAQLTGTKRIQRSALRNEQPMTETPIGAITNPSDLSIPHNHGPHNHGSSAQSKSLCATQTASAYNDDGCSLIQSVGFHGVSWIPFDGTPDHAGSDVSESFEERSLNEDVEVTGGPNDEDTDVATNRNGSNAQNVYKDIRWESEHNHWIDHVQSQILHAPQEEQANEQGHKTSAGHIPVAMPDSQELIAPLTLITSADIPDTIDTMASLAINSNNDLFDAIHMMALVFPDADTNLPDASDLMMASFATGANAEPLNAIDMYPSIST